MTQDPKSIPLWDRMTPASAVSKAERDQLFEAIQEAIEGVEPQAPERVELQSQSGAAIKSHGQDAAGTYIGPSTVQPKRGAELPTAKVRVDDPSRRAVTQRSLRVPTPPRPTEVDLPKVPTTSLRVPLAMGSLLLGAAGIIGLVLQPSSVSLTRLPTALAPSAALSAAFSAQAAPSVEAEPAPSAAAPPAPSAVAPTVATALAPATAVAPTVAKPAATTSATPPTPEAPPGTGLPTLLYNSKDPDE